MPLPHDTAVALGIERDGVNFRHCDSRSLMFDRLANPSLEKDDRRDFFLKMSKKTPVRDRILAWQSFLRSELGVAIEDMLFAQLQSRLMVNMAGGVMENAGLCLDRFGLPYIPGSAVKGCARRAALAAVHEWCETGQKPGSTEADKDNIFNSACDKFTEPVAMLAVIARTFGWCEQDWKTRDQVLNAVMPRSHEDDAQFQARREKLWSERRSDFAWACGRQWESIRAGALAALGSLPASGTSQGASAGGPSARVPRIRDFAGGVSFLPAYPVDLGMTGPLDGLPLPVPDLGNLELDVVTVHHKKYYAGPENPNNPHSVAQWEREWGSAPDIEEPVPNVFPAVAPGHVFTYALLPLRGAGDGLVQHARTWLKTGLEHFGLGAKTNAGYGWFTDATDVVRSAQNAAQAAQADQERKAKEKADRETARATLQPDLAFLEKLRAMKEPDLRGQINPFATDEQFWTQKDERVQLTVFYFLRVTAPELMVADRVNPKSKIAKAIANLSAKFPHVASPQP